jgi:hypothetical protein
MTVSGLVEPPAVLGLPLASAEPVCCLLVFDFVNFMPEEIHVLATGLATYESSDSTTAKVTNR